MRILVDADCCSRKLKLILEIVSERLIIPIIFFCDYAHNIESAYGFIRKFDIGKNSVDHALLSECKEHDMVITSDYFVYDMAEAKRAFVIYCPRGLKWEQVEFLCHTAVKFKKTKKNITKEDLLQELHENNIDKC